MLDFKCLRSPSIETGSQKTVAQSVLKLETLMPLPLQCWGYRCVPLWLAVSLVSLLFCDCTLASRLLYILQNPAFPLSRRSALGVLSTKA